MPLTSSVIHLVQYPPERLVDAEVVNIAGGGAMVPSPLYLDSLDQIGKMVLLDSVATSKNSDVSIQVSADGKLWPPGGQSATSELNANVTDEWQIDAMSKILLTAQASAAVTNYILSYGLWVWPPTVVDKLLNGVRLSPAEQDLADRYLPDGWVPARVTPYEIVRRLYQGKKYVIAGALPTVDSRGQYMLGYGNPPTGYFDVLLEIGVDASAGGTYNLAQQLTNGIQVYIERDADKPLQSFNAAGFPWSSTYATDTGLWMPGAAKTVIVARNSWRVYAQAAPNNSASNIPYRMVAMRCLETDAHRAHWGIDGPSQDVINQVLAGVL